MTGNQRDDLMMCIGKMQGIMSMLEFEEDDSESTLIQNRINDVLLDMEMIVKEVDIHDRTFDQRHEAKTEDPRQ